MVEPARNHNGSAIDAKDVFFVEPPGDIGEISSATTSAPRDRTRMKTRIWKKMRGSFRAGFGCMLISFLAGLLLSKLLTKTFEVQLVVALVFMLVMIVFFVRWTLQDLRTGTCTFVGTDGIARATRFGKVGWQVLSFPEVRHLYVSVHESYTNTVYSGTNYHYVFRNRDNQEAFRILGTFKEKHQHEAATDNEIHFAAAAQMAWTAYRSQEIETRVGAGGARFEILKRGWLRLDNHSLVIHLRDEEEQIPLSEIAEVALAGRHLVIESTGATEGLFSADGILKIDADQVGDLLALIQAVKARLGQTETESSA